MVALDATLTLVGPPTLSVPSDEQIQQGQDFLEVGLPVGIALPFSADGTNPVLAPIAVLRFQMQRPLAEEFFKKGLEAAEQLPDKRHADILRASNMGEVEAAAKRMSNIIRP